MADPPKYSIEEMEKLLNDKFAEYLEPSRSFGTGKEGAQMFLCQLEEVFYLGKHTQEEKEAIRARVEESTKDWPHGAYFIEGGQISYGGMPIEEYMEKHKSRK